MADYRLTPAAKADLIDIWNYTVDFWGEKQAEKYLYAIETKLEQLAVNPEIGRKRPEIAPGYHSFPVEKHIIFYQKSNASASASSSFVRGMNSSRLVSVFLNSA